MIRFLVFSDLHYDDTSDGDRRIETILERTRKRAPDLIVSLGDLCHPTYANQKILKRFASLGVPFYPIIGNHETDDCTLSEIMNFFSINSPYYRVICKTYKLLFLNTCYFRHDGYEEAYYNRNYQNRTAIYPVVPAEELRWLKEELSDGMKCIIFSHHSLINDFAQRGVHNRADIRKLLAEKTVLLCMNGHDHGDHYAHVDGIPYMTVNSANYVWLGSHIASSKTMQEKFAHLHGMLQYKQAMSAYIEIDDHQIRICGMEGEYLSMTPDDLGLHDDQWNGVSIKPRIASHCICHH